MTHYCPTQKESKFFPFSWFPLNMFLFARSTEEDPFPFLSSIGVSDFVQQVESRKIMTKIKFLNTEAYFKSVVRTNNSNATSSEQLSVYFIAKTLLLHTGHDNVSDTVPISSGLPQTFL